MSTAKDVWLKLFTLALQSFLTRNGLPEPEDLAARSADRAIKVLEKRNMLCTPAFTFEGNGTLKEEDGGSALLLGEWGSKEDDGVFVRVQSWDSNKRHAEAQKIRGKKLRIEIYVVEE